MVTLKVIPWELIGEVDLGESFDASCLFLVFKLKMGYARATAETLASI